MYSCRSVSLNPGSNMSDVRADGLVRWARMTDPDIPPDATLKPVSDDASFRRYFRFTGTDIPHVYVDAPPAHEDNESFIRISAALAGAGLSCPVVDAADVSLGYMKISDLGDTLYLDEITATPAAIPALYRDAVEALLVMQRVTCDMPVYDREKLQQEMNLFHEWFLPRQLGFDLSDADMQMLQSVYDYLLESALIQPQVFVHRDYHCRNLMVVADNGPGILDFQDAVVGPVSYDLVSLYKDCYYRFPREQVVAAVDHFHRRLIEAGRIAADAPLLEWFDLMGAQRHLKCAGIFSRLHLRDGKPGYLADIPLVIDYLLEVATLYPRLETFGNWLQEVVRPRLAKPEYQR